MLGVVARQDHERRRIDAGHQCDMVVACLQRDLHVLGGRLKLELADEEPIGDARELVLGGAGDDAARAARHGIDVRLAAERAVESGEIGTGVAVARRLARFDRERQPRDGLLRMLGKVSGVIDARPAAEPGIGRLLARGRVRRLVLFGAGDAERNRATEKNRQNYTPRDTHRALLIRPPVSAWTIARRTSREPARTTAQVSVHSRAASPGRCWRRPDDPAPSPRTTLYRRDRPGRA